MNMEPTKDEKDLIKKSQEYADKNNFKLNPDEKILLGIIRGLLRNKKFKGEIYCPCRIVTGNKQEDKKIICPCIYHMDEIAKDGQCHCRLFVKK